MCLGADVMRGENQKPFDGKIDYDYIMWIDSDILFTPEQFRHLLQRDEDIVSGLYLMEGGRQFATVKDWDEEHFKRNGSFRFMTPDDFIQPPDQRVSIGQVAANLLSVAYTGMGFMLVKKGVFERLEYPWFKPLEMRLGNAVDFTMEDVSFCLRAREKGFSVMVDPMVKVGHEKAIVL